MKVCEEKEVVLSGKKTKKKPEYKIESRIVKTSNFSTIFHRYIEWSTHNYYIKRKDCEQALRKLIADRRYKDLFEYRVIDLTTGKVIEL